MDYFFMKWIYIILTTFLSSFSHILLAQEEVPKEIDGVITINIEQAKRLHSVGVTFIDIRPFQQWQYGHVEGAVSLDLRNEFRQLSIPGSVRKRNADCNLRKQFLPHACSNWQLFGGCLGL